MRQLKGKITSDKMDKTCVVEVSRLKKHPRYLKYFEVTDKYKAHDEEEKFSEGEEVVIEETSPISKDKRWKVVGRVKDIE
ncbi:MAG: 30S ribosomal protein S17 [Candidatus Magasanikbacteria bacterium]